MAVTTTTGYDHHVTATLLPKTGLGITAVGSATSTAITNPPSTATSHLGRDHVSIVAQVDHMKR